MRLWPFLVAAMLAFAWLQPHHYYPWTAFHANAVVATWMFFAGAILFAIGIRPVEWSKLAVVALLMALGVWLQFAGGLIVHTGDAVMTSMQLIGCALILVHVRAIHARYGLQQIGDVVFSAIVIAGIASVAGALYQVFQIVPKDQFAGLGIWIMAIPDGVRPAGNVAQPNELATLLVWAMVGGLWAVHRNAIRWPVFALLSCYLAIGLSITQSRVGVLEVIVLTVILALGRGLVGGWTASILVAIAGLVQISLFIAWPALTDYLLLDYSGGRRLAQLADNAARLDIYQHVAFAISQKPWLGYGMTTLAPAQWTAADHLTGLHAYFHASHNLLLDILAWWGIPIGLCLIGFLVWWSWAVVRKIRDMTGLLFLCALVSFVVHALVELPHWSPAYLFPATIFVACLDCTLRQPSLSRARAGFYASLLIFAGSGLGLIIYDYVRLEENYTRLRAEELRIRTVSEVPLAVALPHLADYLRMSRMIARPNAAPETIAWMERTVHGIPNYNTQLTHAVTLALSGRKDEARMWMRRLNAVAPVSYHPECQRVWRSFQRRYPELIGEMQWPELEAKSARQP